MLEDEGFYQNAAVETFKVTVEQFCRPADPGCRALRAPTFLSGPATSLTAPRSFILVASLTPADFTYYLDRKVFLQIPGRTVGMPIRVQMIKFSYQSYYYYLLSEVCYIAFPTPTI